MDVVGRRPRGAQQQPRAGDSRQPASAAASTPTSIARTHPSRVCAGCQVQRMRPARSATRDGRRRACVGVRLPPRRAPWRRACTSAARCRLPHAARRLPHAACSVQARPCRRPAPRWRAARHPTGALHLLLLPPAAQCRRALPVAALAGPSHPSSRHGPLAHRTAPVSRAPTRTTLRGCSCHVTPAQAPLCCPLACRIRSIADASARGRSPDRLTAPPAIPFSRCTDTGGRRLPARLLLWTRSVSDSISVSVSIPCCVVAGVPRLGLSTRAAQPPAAAVGPQDRE